MFSTQFNRLSRVIAILINSNKNINTITKMELFTEINNYTNDIIVHQIKIENQIKDLQQQVDKLANNSMYVNNSMYSPWPTKK